MTIEIHEPKLEAFIRERMASGHFRSIEAFLAEALLTAPAPRVISEHKQSFTQFMKGSPLWGSGLVLERKNDPPRLVDL